MVTELSALAVTWIYLPLTDIKGVEKEVAIFSLLSDSEANWLIASSPFYMALRAGFNL